jgi:hypothetical protein
MVSTGGILTTERFSHTVYGSPLYHNHEWLTQLVFFMVYQLGGSFLLAVLGAACAMTAIVGAWRLVAGPADTRFGWLIVLLLGTASEWAIRPQVISLAVFVLAVHLVLSDRKRDAWLPLLCLVWSNMHAVAVTGAVIAGCSVVEAILWSRERIVRSLLVFAACLAVPLVTPLGWHYWPRVLEVVRLARALQIQEYRSAFELAQLPFWALAAFFALTARRGLMSTELDRATRLLIVIASVFAVAGALSVRNIPMFVLTAVPAISRVRPATVKQRVEKPAPAGAAVLLGLVLAGAAGAVAYAWRDDGAHLGWVPMRPGAVAAVRQCDGPLFNGFADGGVLTWFVPERRILVDSRGVEAYPLDLLLKSRDADMAGRYESLFSEFGIRCAAVANGSVMASQLAKNPAMELRFADEQWRVFATRP